MPFVRMYTHIVPSSPLDVMVFDNYTTRFYNVRKQKTEKDVFFKYILKDNVCTGMETCCSLVCNLS